MNAPCKIVLYFIAVFLVGALLAPPLFHLVESLRPAAEAHGWLHYEVKNGEPSARGWCAFLDADFAKVSSRAILIAAVALLFPLFRALRIANLDELGLHHNPRRWQHFALGFGVSVAVMALLGSILLQLGVYRLREPTPWKDLLPVLLTGLVVGPMEEWMFRGAILGSFRRSMPRWWALASVSAIFSILHFVSPPGITIEPSEVNWASGFELLPMRFAHFRDPLRVLGGFTTLFCFGWVCGWAAIRTRGLALGIGFHAGMVLGKFGFNKITSRPKAMRDLLPWIGEDMTVGLVGVGVVLLVGALLWLALRKRVSAGQGRGA